MACSQGEGACCPATPGQATWVMSLTDSVAQQAKKNYPYHIFSAGALDGTQNVHGSSDAAKVALPGTK